VSFLFAIVQSVSLSSSPSPNEGFLTVSIENKNYIACSSAPNPEATNIVCAQLGYWKTQRNSSAVANSKLEKFSGSMNCNGDETTLSQCETKDAAKACSKQSYVTCKYE
jgi:hypothetical protein